MFAAAGSVARWYPTEPDFENLVKFQSLWCRKISVWNQTSFWWNPVKFQTIWYRENFGLEPDIFLVKSDVISSFLRKNFRLEPYTGVKSHSQVATSNSPAHVTHQPGCRITGAAGSLLDCRRLGLELAAREVAINWPSPSVSVNLFWNGARTVYFMPKPIFLALFGCDWRWAYFFHKLATFVACIF